MIHTDANRHPHSGSHLHQILNFIIYLNEGWQSDWGGDLELWTADRKPHTRISPIANRAVLFLTGTNSFHGHPEPLKCPPVRRRNSLAVYYYTYNRQRNEDYEGMQRAARWVATTEADAALARKLTERGREQIAALAGTIVKIRTADLRIEPDPSWATSAIVVPFLWDALDPDARKSLLSSYPIKLIHTENVVPFARISPSETDAVGGEQSLIAALAEDGAVYMVRRDGARPFFFGYIAAFLRVLANAGTLG